MKFRLWSVLAAFALAWPAAGLAEPVENMEHSPGAVYTLDNDPTGNHVLIFNRSAKGALTPAAAVATGGLGTGAGLGNQGGLILSQRNRWLFAINPGSDEISVFAVRPDGLILVDKIGSGGQNPISLTSYGNLLYVLNAGGNVGGTDNVTGFVVSRHGKLWPLPGSTWPLSADMTMPAQIGFNQRGRVLVVTEKATDTIDTYALNHEGWITGQNIYDSAGMTPFGFAFAGRNLLLVSEAAGGATDASTVSSYRLSNEGYLEVVDPTVPTTETAACWVLVTKDNRHAYTTNTGSGSVSGFNIGHDGNLSLLDPDGKSGATGAGPIDMALSQNGRFLYVLTSGSQTIDAFGVEADGRLIALPGVSLGLAANGLAAR